MNIEDKMIKMANKLKKSSCCGARLIIEETALRCENCDLIEAELSDYEYIIKIK